MLAVASLLYPAAAKFGSDRVSLASSGAFRHVWQRLPERQPKRPYAWLTKPATPINRQT